MKKEHKRHLQAILKDFKKETKAKYKAGAEEHGGHLHDMTELQLIENAMDEAIDQYVYLHTVKEKLEAKS